jgi:hypothetical protein
VTATKGKRDHTFAISLHVFPASRICLSLCSSPAVHGVLVLPVRFLPLSSVNSEGIDTLALEASVGRDNEVPGGRVSSCLGLLERGRLRDAELM